MSVTLDIPPHILERASKYAASEGISLDALIERTLTTITDQTPLLEQQPQTKPTSPFGLFPGIVLYMAEDFNAPLDDFKEYME